MNDLDIGRFVELETAVWNALTIGDGEADAALLSEDFLGVYPTGFADRSGHVDQLRDGPTVASFEISDTHLIALSEHAVLLCYRADWRRASTGAAAEVMYISSLWCERDGRWINTFSQDTPAVARPIPNRPARPGEPGQPSDAVAR